MFDCSVLLVFSNFLLMDNYTETDIERQRHTQIYRKKQTHTEAHTLQTVTHSDRNMDRHTSRQRHGQTSSNTNTDIHPVKKTQVNSFYHLWTFMKQHNLPQSKGRPSIPLFDQNQYSLCSSSSRSSKSRFLPSRVVEPVRGDCVSEGRNFLF